MRLTLRTLLAYLDDVLEPSETKLMGQKIQESPVAGELISKIREVMRRRRLSAPDVSGPHVGIDPNIVAQYLDNTLPSDQVADVERVLLSSDELLAEVAACHQVLTLVLGEPCDVSEASRERLYALGPVAAADQLQVEEPVGASEGSASAAPATTKAPTPAATPAPQPERTTEIPEYLRPSPWSQHVVPTAVVALLIVLCVGLLFSDPGFLTGLSEAKRELAKVSRKGESSVAAGPSTTDAASAIMPEATNPDPILIETPASLASTTKPAPNPGKVPGGLDPAPPPDEPEAGTSTPKPAATTDTKPKTDTPADAAVAANAKPSVPAAPVPASPLPVTTVPETKPATVPPAVPVVPVQYTSNEGVFARFDAAAAHWLLVPHRSVLTTGELFACLDPYEAGLDIGQGALRGTLLGGSVMRLVGPSDLAPNGIDIRRGRLLLQASRKETKDAAKIAVVIGQDAWTLELLSADTVVGIEITLREPTRFEKPHDVNWYLGTLYVLSGSAKWTPSQGQALEVGNRTGVMIAPTQGGPAVKPTPISFSTPPDWTDSTKRKQSPLRSFEKPFEKEFEADLPMDQSMQSLIKHRNPKISELAVRGLVVTDSYPAVVKALAECGHEEGRFAARDGLLVWLPMNADHGKLLMSELEMRYPPADAEVVYRLLWGFTREDGRDKVTSLQLVEWLDSGRIEVREMADFWIERLIGRKTDYLATNSPAQRRSQIRRIEKIIEDDGALIKGE